MKKTISLILSLLMLLSLLPAAVLADDAPAEAPAAAEAASGSVKTLEVSVSSSADVDAAIAELAHDDSIRKVVLKTPYGSDHIDFAAIPRLREAVEGIEVEYVFELFGKEVDINDSELIYENTRIGNDGVMVFYELIPCMCNLKRLVLDDCEVDNEIMADLRDRFEDVCSVVWRVYWDSGAPRTSTLTDSIMIRASGTVTSNRISNLKYCRDIRFIDMGHSPQLLDIEFTRSMPNLQVLIIVDSCVKSLEPLSECKELLMLEIVNCSLIQDLSPLAECKKLRLLNFSACFGVTDLTPLYPLQNVERLYAHSYEVPEEQFDEFAATHPDCWVHYGLVPDTSVSANYSIGWRLDDAPLVTAAWYDELHILFGIGEQYYSDGGYFSTIPAKPYKVPLDELEYFKLDK